MITCNTIFKVLGFKGIVSDNHKATKILNIYMNAIKYALV